MVARPKGRLFRASLLPNIAPAQSRNSAASVHRRACITSLSPPREHGDAFDVMRLREHVDEVEPLHGIRTTRDQDVQIARERRRITRHVDDATWPLQRQPT